MNNKIKLITAAIAAVVSISLLLSSCSGLKGLDVVAKSSITSFDEVLKAVPDKVKADEENAGWSLEAPDGSVRFIWSDDYTKAPLHNVMLEFNAEPFLKAGLDTSKLPENYAVYNNMIMVGNKFGDDNYKGENKPLSAYENIVQNYRDIINFHTSLDHFGVKLGDGNMFEWAKDMKTNGYNKQNQDKDIVFVLNSEPLIKAGVDPEKVEGWTYTQVTVEENGSTKQVWKLLKPFDLK